MVTIAELLEHFDVDSSLLSKNGQRTVDDKVLEGNVIKNNDEKFIVDATDSGGRIIVIVEYPSIVSILKYDYQGKFIDGESYTGDLVERVN